MEPIYLNKKDDLKPVGTYLIAWSAPYTTSTEIPCKREKLLKITDHVITAPYGSANILEYAEAVEVIAIKKHICGYSLSGKYELPPARYIDSKEAQNFILECDNITKQSTNKDDTCQENTDTTTTKDRDARNCDNTY